MDWAKDIEFTVQIWKEGNQFVAHAMSLDQREGNMAKSYQVRQVRAVITKYGLVEIGDK